MQKTKGSYPGFRNFIKFQKKMQDNQFDVIVGLSAFKGFGKSTFGIQTGRFYIREYMPKEKYDLRSHVAYDNYEIEEKVDKLPVGAPLNCDEAVRFAMAEDFMLSESKETKKFFTQIRVKKHLFTFCIPDIWWLDKKYREGMMTIWIHLIAKGYAVMFLPDLRPGVDDRWHRKDILKIVKPFSFFTPVKEIMKSFRKLPTYYDEFSFPALSDEMYMEYLRIRDEAVFQRDPGFVKGKYNFISKLPAWNMYNRWDEIVKVLAEKEFQKPTHEFMQKYLYWNPITRRPVVSREAVTQWLTSIDSLRNR